MVSRLEMWAKDARAHGRIDEAAVIEKQSEDFRKAGVPDDFPQVTVEG